MLFPLIGKVHKMKNLILFQVLIFFSHASFLQSEPINSTVIICGICRNIESAVNNTIENIEKLGKSFKDYGVIIYENNSQDQTVIKLLEWAQKNKKVFFITEKLTPDQEPASRTEKIARARNQSLSMIKNSKHKNFEYLIMVDLDFKSSWPIDEICKTIEEGGDWDCVSSNGVATEREMYWDRYAFRDKYYPFGPELNGDSWWHDIFNLDKGIYLKDEDSWRPVYSAFGGLAIYKMKSILNFSYSGLVTLDLQEYYKKILLESLKDNKQIQSYLQLNGLTASRDLTKVPIIFRNNTFNEFPAGYQPITCCEHVPLHASMALNGFGKFYVNPKMVMRY